MKCIKCGKEIPDSAKFCSGCGQLVPRCPTCGRLLTQRTRFCVSDGTPIPDEIQALLPPAAPPAQKPAPGPVPGMKQVEPLKTVQKTGKGRKRATAVLVSVIVVVCLLIFALLGMGVYAVVNGELSVFLRGESTVETQSPTQVPETTAPAATQPVETEPETTAAPETTPPPETTAPTEPAPPETTAPPVVTEPVVVTPPSETAPPAQLEEYIPYVDVADVSLQLLYWIENCDSAFLTESDVMGMDEDTCRLARNAIFAKRGRKFDSPALTYFFEQFDWYAPYIEPADFSNALLNGYELHNIDVVLAYEAKCGY